MNTIEFEFSYLMILHNHARGLTAYLPSAGHDATLEIGGQSISLQSADVVLMENGTPMPGDKQSPVSAEAGVEFIDVDSIVGPLINAKHSAIAPRHAIATDAMTTVPELHARVQLPDGVLTYQTPKSPKPPQTWEFDKGNGTTFRRAPTDRATLSITVDPTRRYAVLVTTPHFTAQLAIEPGDTICVKNADRPTSDTGNPAWYELRFLLDLLALPKMVYPTPVPALGMTPITVRCPIVHAGYS